MKLRLLAWLLLGAGTLAQAATPFPLADVRLGAGPFLDAQTTNLNYLMAMEPDRLLAPFLREAGLAPRKPGYGNWESSGLDGHMGGHYLSALALMYASTGDAETLRRLNYMVAELQRAQHANGDGYLGGIPGGRQAWRDVAAGKLEADGFSVNGKWVPWYNLHKVYAGLRDAYRYGGNRDARAMLVALSDWALALTARLSPEQMQAMLRSEHGGMNEIFVDVAEITGDRKYLDLALRFSHQVILAPLARQDDQLTGLHANTQIPKVIGFQRIHDATGRKDMGDAARFFWQTVVEKRSVAIGGNSVKEHFHSRDDFAPMVHDVEGPETCNTYNMLKLTQMLFAAEQKGAYGDYYERALYNHILSSQRPQGGFVYFTPLRPNHYRVYSQPDQGMWCCVGSGIESHAKYGEFIYAHEKDTLFVNLFMASTLDWKAQGVRLTQATRFPDVETTRLTIDRATPGSNTFTVKIRYPGWVAPGRMTVQVNGQLVRFATRPGGYVALTRSWRSGDRIDLRLPMTTHLEQLPDKSNYYAVLHGPVVLAARTRMPGDERLQYLADDARMGHIASGPVCPMESAPMFVSDSVDFIRRFKPVAGKPLTFTAPGLVHGADGSATEFVPFFRLHESRYTMYWQHATPVGLKAQQAANAAGEAERLALDARTVDQVAPGEQQPESDHFFKGEGIDAGVSNGRHWRHASKWFSYELKDPKQQAAVLRLTYARADAGRRFDIVVNGQLLAEVTLTGDAAGEFYTVDYPIPAALRDAAQGLLNVRFVAQAGSLAGGLYGLRLLR
ncbi:MAG: glycoside hydrolase family 127 protein [Massilia sp.]